MNLRQALWILERVHTRDDYLFSYTVHSTPNPDLAPCTQGEYDEAWGVVRAWLRNPLTLHDDEEDDRKADEAVANNRRHFDEAHRKADEAEKQVGDAMQQQYDRNQGR